MVAPEAAKLRVLSCFFLVRRRAPRSTLFPYTTLFRSLDAGRCQLGGRQFLFVVMEHAKEKLDRKSTRLNSSHVSNSYAVFCLKKKTADVGDDRAHAQRPLDRGLGVLGRRMSVVDELDD